MAGTIFGLGLSQQFDLIGDFLSGGLLSIFEVGSTTPVDVYQDTALTVLHPFPIVLDAYGRVPAFWVADGSYRARLTDAADVSIFDVDNILAIGPSDGGGGGGGGGSTVDPNALLATMDVIWSPRDGTRTGFVRCNGRTIGSSSSGATERAAADCEDLFEALWNALANAQAAVSTGRGANAAADFAANKTIALPDLRGRAPFGLDDMGGARANRITDDTIVDADTPGVSGGEETHLLTLDESPGHGHAITAQATSSNGAHTHFTVNGDSATGTLSAANSVVDARNSGDFNNYILSGGATTPTLGLSSSNGAHTHTVTGGTDNAGGDGDHNNMPPALLGSFYMKL